jgi:Holliday junction resolvase RusA-like endonuclease
MTIRLEPRPSRYIRTRYGIAPTTDHVKYVESLRFWMKNYELSFPDRSIPLWVEITYYIKKLPYGKYDDPVSKLDLDNLTKPVLDALKPFRKKRKLIQEGVIADDGQITKLTLEKKFTEKLPKIVILIESRSPQGFLPL